MKNTATLSEMRTDFPSIKKKVKEHGEVIITIRGKPVYSITPLTTDKATRTSSAKPEKI